MGSKSSSSIPQLQLKAQKKLTTDKLNPLESTSSDVNLASPKELSDKETNSPKQKTWRGLMARQLKKIHGGHPNSSESGYVMEGASMSVPLEKCPPVSKTVLCIKKNLIIFFYCLSKATRINM